MALAVSAIFLVLWALGMMSSYTMGGYIHILLATVVLISFIEIVAGLKYNS